MTPQAWCLDSPFPYFPGAVAFGFEELPSFFPVLAKVQRDLSNRRGTVQRKNYTCNRPETNPAGLQEAEMILTTQRPHPKLILRD